MINDFRYGGGFLSNFYPCKVTILGHTYNSSEAAYQAQKCSNEEDRKKFETLTASEAKKLGRQIPMVGNWDEIRAGIMHAVCRAKFYRNTDLADKLLATGDEELVEGNTWGDTFWGDCDGVGENQLGKILMKIREDMRKDDKFLSVLNKLDPCPFCGSKDIIIKGSENGLDEKIWCCSCQANIPRFKGSRRELIQAWNNRSNGWISVKDRLPTEADLNEYGEVLVTNGKLTITMNFRNSGFWRGALEQTKKVTYWQPLPKPIEKE